MILMALFVCFYLHFWYPNCFKPQSVPFWGRHFPNYYSFIQTHCPVCSQHGDYWLIGKTIQIREEMSYNGSLSRQQTAMLGPPWKLCSWKLTRIDKCMLTKSRSSNKKDSKGSGIQEIQTHIELFKCVLLYQKGPWSHLLEDRIHLSWKYHFTMSSSVNVIFCQF